MIAIQQKIKVYKKNVELVGLIIEQNKDIGLLAMTNQISEQVQELREKEIEIDEDQDQWELIEKYRPYIYETGIECLNEVMQKYVNKVWIQSAEQELKQELKDQLKIKKLVNDVELLRIDKGQEMVKQLVKVGDMIEQYYKQY